MADRPDPLLILPDQLSLEVGPLARAVESGRRGRVLLLESGEWLTRRPYHRQRIALILLNVRAFGEELQAAGFEVERLEGSGTMRSLLEAWLDAHPDTTLHGLEPAEREMRLELEPLAAQGRLAWQSNPFFLTDRSMFEEACGRGAKSRFRMDTFYRKVRAATGLLMEPDGSPEGGRISFDAENRKPWKGEPAAPVPPRFAMTPRRREVAQEIESRFAAHPGTLDVESLPATLDDALRLWSWAKSECLEHFGPYEDAMSRRSRGLFHTRISPVLNLGRILPRRLVDDVATMTNLPLPSREGFIRQVIGWREFVRHVHDATDGLRAIRGERVPTRATPGDGGWSAWSGGSWSPSAPPPAQIDGGSDANALGPGVGVPPAFWGRESGLACLDHVVSDVWAEGWSHHITRLMVLGNIASLLDVSPRDLADWFWIAYADAWEWVVEPNVMGMATWGLGGAMTTKPYIAGSAYIDRMSDYCRGCRFVPKAGRANSCPLTRLYWAFLDRHEASLRDNPRLGVVMQAMRKRPEAERRGDRAVFARVQSILIEGQPLPHDVVSSTAD